MTTVSQAIAARDAARVPAEPATELAIRPGQDFWTAKQQAALQVLGIKNATNADLAVFLHYCQKTGLDPFSRQIYMICRREKQGDQWVDKQTIQVGIDGFRVIRDRIAARQGVTVEYEDSRWYDADGITYEVWLQEGHPAACGMAVLKDGKRFPAVVRYSAFAQTGKDGKPNSMWNRMDAEQLEKCAEAKALRRAFPHDLGGVFLPEELPPDAPRTSRRGQHAITDRIAPPSEDVPAASISPGGDPGAADPPSSSPGPAAPPPGAAGHPDGDDGTVATQRQISALFVLFGHAGWKGDEYRDRRRAVLSVLAAPDGEPPLNLSSSTNLTVAEASRARKRLMAIEEREGDGFAEALAALAADPDIPAIGETGDG